MYSSKLQSFFPALYLCACVLQPPLLIAQVILFWSDTNVRMCVAMSPPCCASNDTAVGVCNMTSSFSG